MELTKRKKSMKKFVMCANKRKEKIRDSSFLATSPEIMLFPLFYSQKSLIWTSMFASIRCIKIASTNSKKETNVQSASSKPIVSSL